MFNNVDNIESQAEQRPSRWKQMRITLFENRRIFIVILIGFTIFLGASIFLTCAGFESHNMPITSTQASIPVPEALIATAQYPTTITIETPTIAQTQTEASTMSTTQTATTTQAPITVQTTTASTTTTTTTTQSIERNPAPTILNQTVCNKTCERLCTSSECIRAASYLLESVNFQVDPCEDFYEFTCGNWAKYHTRPKSLTQWSWTTILKERVEDAIKVLLESKPSENESKVVAQSRIMFKSCMKLDTRKKQMESGRRKIKKLLKEYCFPYIHKGDRNCTFSRTATWNKLREQIVVAHRFRSFNIFSPGIKQKLQHYIKFLQPYETIAIDTMIKMIQNATNQLPKIRYDYKQMNKIDPNGLQSYMWWVVIDNLIGSVRFNYNIYYRNISIHQSNHCAQLVNDRMGMFLGDAIAMPNFLNETKPKLLNSFEDIRSAFNELVENSDWMDQPTKRVVIEKSQAMKVNIGFAEFLLNKTKVDEYLKDFNFTESSLLMNEHNMWNVEKGLNTIAKNHWQVLNMMATEVNARHFYGSNSLMFPMGYLQFPYYGLGIEALNYGAAISIFGHEFAHGFDSKGIDFDKNGKKTDEWSIGTKNEYRNRTNCLIEQHTHFSMSEIDPTINDRSNSKRTLNENISDNIGLLLAYKAYKMFMENHGEEKILPVFEEFRHEQLFFIAYGNRRCASMTSKELKRMNANDDHSLAKFRVNGVVSNLVEFGSAFKCGANSTMVSKSPCRIW
ncbi:neprilysin-1-like [Sitodiplosis mosellana]|uniref:neprilysin-1-like n=1 Tax=Sitodiplosis mosellana TaxID=263140 RepID=UPI002444CE24|nr:neprilysin-1-like [Sitodiplosis mosellana]